MRSISFLALIFCAVSCSDPHDVVLPRDISQLDKDKKVEEALSKLPDEEKKLLGAYLIRTGMGQVFGGEGLPPGTTIGEAVEKQRAWAMERAKEEAEAAALAEKVRQAREAQTREMNEALRVAVIELKLRPKNYDRGIYSDYFSLSLAFENRTTKALAGAKGTMVVSDMFGETIKRIGVSYDDGVKAGGTAVWKGSMDHNQFMAQDNKLATTKFENLRFRWEPEMYLFEDGVKMSVVGE